MTHVREKSTVWKRFQPWKDQKKMSKILLYHSPYSPFSRSVLLLSRFLNLDIEVKVLNLLDDEQLEPEFLELNPQHCVPTLDDNGFIIWESRAVLAYLLESKAPQLVPTSPKEKAIVNQRLYYEMGKLAKTYAALWVRKHYRTFCSLVRFFFEAPLFEGGNELESKTIEEIREVLRFVDEHYFPHGNEWIASANITIADFAFVSVIAGLTVSLITD